MNKFLKRAALTFLILFILINVIAAFHAYKFTHFYNDQTLPRLKPEQMSFGEKLKAVMFGVDYPKSVVVDSFSIPHKKITLTTSDGLHLSAWYAPTFADDTIVHLKGTVILFHGHASSKSSVIAQAEAFNRMDYKVLLVDFRAHGESEGNTCTIGYTESKDVKAAYDFVVAQGETNIVLWGISLGAATIMKAVDDYKLKPSKVILEMPFASLLQAAEGRIRTMGLPEEPLGALLTFWGGTEQGFWAFNHRPVVYAKSITCPVLLQWGIKDARVTRKETDAIFENLASTNKTLVLYKKSGHENLLLNEPEQWLHTVGKFLEN